MCSGGKTRSPRPSEGLRKEGMGVACLRIVHPVGTEGRCGGGLLTFACRSEFGDSSSFQGAPVGILRSNNNQFGRRLHQQRMNAGRCKSITTRIANPIVLAQTEQRKWNDDTPRWDRPPENANRKQRHHSGALRRRGAQPLPPPARPGPPPRQPGREP